MPPSTAEMLKLKLELDILTFIITPGERLDETKLADRYGTSRTPVREALRQLSADGLVEIRPHRGAVVAKLSIAELVDMFEMMAVLEGVCARFAAMRATAEELEAIREAHEASRPYAEAGAHANYYRANAQFHESIYRASFNGYLIKQTLMVRNRLGAYRRFQLRRMNRPMESFLEHEKIYQAIRRGAPEEADKLMRDHISVQGANITSLISSLPPEYFSESPRSAALEPLLALQNPMRRSAAFAFDLDDPGIPKDAPK